jgi:hypothetical protein
MTFYANHKVPDVILIITGAFALAQVVMSLWSLSDKWEEQGKLNEMTLAKFSKLRSDVKALHSNADGVYDESKFQPLIYESSSVGLNYDNALNVHPPEREAAWAAAVRRFPDPPNKPTAPTSAAKQKS